MALFAYNKAKMKNAKYSINAYKVYKSGYSGKNVNVAVLDTGVFVHTRLKGRIEFFMDIVGNKKECYDDNGHGTHVCGILCGQDIGIAPDAGLYVFKVLDSMGMGRTSDSICALRWIKENCHTRNIKILNFSVGYLPYSDVNEREKILRLIDELWDMGVTVVAAAGNYGPDPFTVTVPGISRKIITVGSYDDIRSGNGPTGCCIVKPEILAPGRDILSLGTRDGTYVKKTGTSMATPIVSGAVALLLERFPDMRPEEIKLRLYNTCKRLGGVQRNAWGLIDVDKFVGVY